MMETKLTINGKPISKARPRFFRRGNFVGTYNSQHTEEGRWMLEARGQIVEKVPEGVPITLRCIFYMPIPKSTSKKKRAEMLYHIKKPDLSNMLKFAEDCLNGLAWHDDSQIAEVFMGKLYSDNPRTEIIIKWQE